MISRMLLPALAAGLVIACGSSGNTGTGGSGGSPGTGGTGGAVVEDCANAVDDDGDDLIDCADPDCASDPHCPLCGDGFLDLRELCEGPNLGTHSCVEQGFNGGGKLACTQTCELDKSGCVSHEDCDKVGDEDHNGLADCMDPACSSFVRCMSLTVDQQPAVPLTEAAVTLVMKVTDGAGQGLKNKAVQLMAPLGASAPADSVTTDDAGLATFNIRLGRKPGAAVFTAQVPNTDLMTDVQLDVVDPPIGTIQTVANASHISGVDENGPATEAHLGTINDLQVASDSTLYFAEECRVMAISPDGLLSRIAGTGACGAAPDDAVATNTNLNVTAIALDEPKGVLYVDDEPEGKIRALDLTSGQLTTVAGGGTKTKAALDGAAPLDVLIDPNGLSLGPDHVLYVSDTSGRVLAIDLAGQKVSVFALTATTDGAKTCKEPLQVATCTATACNTIFDASGKAFIQAAACGLTTGGGSGKINSSPSVVRIDAGGALALVAGRQKSLLLDNYAANTLTFEGPFRGVFDGGGNLLAVSGNRLVRIDGNTDRFTSLGGGVTPGFAGEEEPVSSASFSNPASLVVGPNGDVYIADSSNLSVRRVVGLGESMPRAISVELVSGDQQTAYVAQKVANPLSFKLRDSTGAPLANQAVVVVPPDPGFTVYQGDTTDSTGLVSREIRMGLIPGNKELQVGIVDIHGNLGPRPGKFRLSTFAANAGDIFSEVGAETSGPTLLDPALTIPAPSFHVNGLVSIGADPDGTVYLGEPSQILKITADGAMTRFAGSGSFTGHKGDGALATLAEFNSLRVAPDDAHGAVYLIDHDVSSLIRKVDLTTGFIQPFAGGGTMGPGDGGLATDANLADAEGLAVDTAGKVYVASNGAGQGVRMIDPATGIITSLIPAGPCGAGDGLSTASSLALSANVLYVSGQICHGGSPHAGVLSQDAQGNLKYLGGYDSRGLAVGPTGLIIMGHLSGDAPETSFVDALDPNTGAIAPIAGGGFKAGDYVPAVQFALIKLRDVAQGAKLYVVTSTVMEAIW